MREIEVVGLCSGLELHVDFKRFKQINIETDGYIFLVTKDRISCRKLVGMNDLDQPMEEAIAPSSIRYSGDMGT